MFFWFLFFFAISCKVIKNLEYCILRFLLLKQTYKHFLIMPADSLNWLTSVSKECVLLCHSFCNRRSAIEPVHCTPCCTALDPHVFSTALLGAEDRTLHQPRTCVENWQKRENYPGRAWRFTGRLRLFLHPFWSVAVRSDVSNFSGHKLAH